MELLKHFCLIIFPFSTIVSSTEIEKPKPEKKCNDFCTLEYEPVCATNEICYKRFGNKCALGVANCHAEEKGECLWDEVPDDYCDCPTQCAYIYSPVCAVSKSRITLFASECTMLETECLTDEKYIIVPTKVCVNDEDQADCSMDQSGPICAFDGSDYATFQNQYIFDLMNSYQNYVWGVHSFEECPACLPVTYYYYTDDTYLLSTY